jgi:hypothetical protein
MVMWDGSAEAGDWAVAQFGDAATVTGDGDDKTLTMWGSWEIPRGTYMINQWGSFNYVPADQLSAYQMAEPAIEPPAPAAEEPPAEEPPAEPPAEETPPAEEPPAEPPAEEPVTDAPPEPETQP